MVRILIPSVLSLLVTTVTAQLPPQVQWFLATDVAASVAKATGPWLPVLDRSTMSIGRYRLATGAADGQQPHDKDELYFVVAGKAKLDAGGQTQAMTAGDCAFVAAGVPHHFVDIEKDLDVLVFFSAAKPTTGGMVAGPVPTEQTPYPETSARGNTRIFYWFGPDSAGQVSLDYGRPVWQPAFARFLQQPAGRRWRCGENFWTSLDTNVPLTIGGVPVPIGQYYAVLQNTKDAGVQLVLLDPQQVRNQRLDAYDAPKTTGGLLIPMTVAESKITYGRLDMELTVDRAARDQGALTIRFGPHELTAPVAIQPHR